jgi:hypothetical protein
MHDTGEDICILRLEDIGLSHVDPMCVRCFPPKRRGWLVRLIMLISARVGTMMTRNH